MVVVGGGVAVIEVVVMKIGFGDMQPDQSRGGVVG